MKLSCAITTTKRDVDYLKSTIESVGLAGFDMPLLVSDGKMGDNYGQGYVDSVVQVGVVPNFRTAMALFQAVDFKIVLQDDVIVSKGLKLWLENQKLRDDCIYSLYTPAVHDSTTGWHELDLVQSLDSPFPWMKTIGACGMMFPYEIAKKFVSEPPPKRTDRLGAAIGEFCSKHSIPLMMHSPSLVQHVGVCSSLTNVPIERKAASFAKEV